MKYRTILFIGAPGSGKGTQGQTLGTLPGFFHCACGDVFRSLDTTTEIGRIFLEYSSRGELVPDEVTVRLWKVLLKRRVEDLSYKPETDYLILDGIPRNVEQARIMDELIDVKFLFHLTCPKRDELMRRLKQRALHDNRIDDANEKVIRKRLRTYDKESRPVIEFYPRERVHIIDAQQRPAQVLNEITSTILENGG
jgi:adenylate kinase